MTAFLRVLDALHRRWRSEDGQGSLRGAQPHFRYLTDEESTARRAVPGLPRNAYNATWLQDLGRVALADLNVQETIYDFSHTAHIETYVFLLDPRTHVLILCCASITAPWAQCVMDDGRVLV